MCEESRLSRVDAIMKRGMIYSSIAQARRQALQESEKNTARVSSVTLTSYRHMKDMDNPGLKLSDFQLVLPSLSVRQIQWLLKDLEATSRAYVLGRTKAARWFLGKRQPELTSGLTSELTRID